MNAEWQPGVASQRSIWRLVVGTLVIAVLYSLVHTWDLRVYAGQLLLLVMLTWALNDEAQAYHPRYSLLAMSAGAACLMGAALLIGRAMGGEYSLAGMSPSALTQWPLALIAIGSALWLGLAPLTGWSLRGYTGAPAALAQSLIVGIPIITLLVRLQGVMATQGQASGDWEAFTTALAWVGGLSAFVAAAGMIASAGTARWESLLGAYTMGLATCALGLDTSLGRYAALVILLSYSAARMMLELSKGIELSLPAGVNMRWAIAIIGCSLAAVPLTVGFVGVWLLGSALIQVGHASAAVMLAGAVILTACGVALHYAYGGFSPGQASKQRASLSTVFSADTDESLRLVVSLIGGVALLVGGIAPRLWLPQVGAIASVAGKAAPINVKAMGLEVSSELPLSQPALASAPVVLLALAGLALAGIGWLVVFLMRSGLYSSGVLRPAAAKRLKKLNEAVQLQPGESTVQPLPAPLPAWWLSLLGLEDGFWRDGVLLLKLGARAGAMLGRLEGRYYMPLALVLTLLALLAITR